MEFGVEKESQSGQCTSMIDNPLSVDKSWPITPGEQLQAQLRTAIRRGEIGPGTALPGVRELAAEVRVNPNTVAAAYRQLSNEGLLVAKRRGGTRVAPGPFLRSNSEAELLRAVERLVGQARRAGWSGADLVRWVAGRWKSRGENEGNAGAGQSLYEFIRSRDYDQS
jgi:DNA-binding transcriptional regulator YhcF (GntR family)